MANAERGRTEEGKAEAKDVNRSDPGRIPETIEQSGTAVRVVWRPFFCRLLSVMHGSCELWQSIVLDLQRFARRSGFQRGTHAKELSSKEPGNDDTGRNDDQKRYGGILEMQSAANRTDGRGRANSEAHLPGERIAPMAEKRTFGVHTTDGGGLPFLGERRVMETPMNPPRTQFDCEGSP